MSSKIGSSFKRREWGRSIRLLLPGQVLETLHLPQPGLTPPRPKDWPSHRLTFGDWQVSEGALALFTNQQFRVRVNQSPRKNDPTAWMT
jgi:hypothetical protein